MPASPDANPATENRTSTAPAGKTDRLRLLLPINHEPDSRWGWRYAIQKHNPGLPVEVCLLHATKRIEYCEVFRTARASAAGQHASAPEIPHLDEAIATFEQAGMAVRGILAAGGAVEGILDMAERLACDEIVLPFNDRPGWLGGFWHRNTVRFIQERERQIPVVTVDENGRPVLGMYARRRHPGLAA